VATPAEFLAARTPEAQGVSRHPSTPWGARQRTGGPIEPQPRTGKFYSPRCSICGWWGSPSPSPRGWRCPPRCYWRAGLERGDGCSDLPISRRPSKPRAVRIFLLPFIGIGEHTCDPGTEFVRAAADLRSTLTGILGVDPAVRESAMAMGMTPRQILWQVELPLAVPSIVSGLRIATVTTIGTATIAAFIGGRRAGRIPGARHCHDG